MTTDTMGGVWTYSLELVRGLAPYGVEVCLAAKGRLSPEQRRAAASLPNATLQQKDFKLEWMADPWEDVCRAGDWLLEIAHSLEPDLIHLNDYCHGTLPWNAPVLVVGHSCVLSWIAAVRGEISRDDRATWQRYQHEVRRGLQGADLVVAPTGAMLQALGQHYGPLGRTRVIHNGCQGTPVREAKQPLAFSAGRFWDEAKNIATLAAAAPAIDWPVAVAGLRHADGAEGRTEGVEWLGPLSRDEMNRMYGRASIYVLPARYEPFGLTPLEAALARTALVLGDLPSLREVWGDAALYVPPQDREQLAAAVNRLIHNEPLRTTMAERAHARSQQLSAARMACAYWNCYRSRMPRRARAALSIGGR